MCGIVGFCVARDHADSIGDLAQRVATMNAAILHRGPDGAGDYAEPGIALAMRRLAVIDLAHGDQPLLSADERVVAFQNGEIYNYRELRDQLREQGYVFKTASDTEVLAHGFHCWGARGLFERLDGMYAVAILDREARQLVLGRDRFGEKPLYIARRDGALAWASSIHALETLPDVDFELDPTALDAYLALHFVPGPQTLFRGIERVQPGEFVEVNIDTVEVSRQRYWAPPSGEVRDRSTRELTELLEAAVESRLIADVPVGVFLSGGLDSSTVAALAARRAPEIETFSMGFHSSTHDESAFARRVAEHVKSRHHHFYFDEDDFASLLPAVARALDEPVGDPAQLPLYVLCREARKFVTVALSGEGGDELFGGYSYYRRFAPAGLNLREHVWQRKRRRRESLPDRLLAHDSSVILSGFPLVLRREQRRPLLASLADEAPTAYEGAVLDSHRRAADPLQGACLIDILTWLPDDLLVKLDRMAMAHSLEGRAPFLQPELASAALALPPARKIRRKNAKLALQEVAEQFLPAEIFTRRKQGFELPMKQWLASWYENQGGVEAYFERRPFPGLDRSATAAFIAHDLENGLPGQRFQFSLLLLLEWFDGHRERRQRALAPR